MVPMSADLQIRQGFVPFRDHRTWYRSVGDREAASTTESPEYEEAMMLYYRRHVCRLDPWPACLQPAFARPAEDSTVVEGFLERAEAGAS
jgi:hypothetical protein